MSKSIVCTVFNVSDLILDENALRMFPEGYYGALYSNSAASYATINAVLSEQFGELRSHK